MAKKKVVEKKICEICKEKEATNIHHKDENHRNNEEKNLQYLCAPCHAELHGNTARVSKLRMLVDLRERAINTRNSIKNQIRGLSFIELTTPESWEIGNKYWDQQIKLLEKQIEEEVKKYPLIEWLTSIKGISYNTSAYLISHIDISRSTHVSDLWRYCGLDATHIKRMKKITQEEAKKFGHPGLKKELLGIVADNFIKQRTPLYREVYDSEKLRQSNIVKTKMHAHRRAIRKMMKIFLQHYYVQDRTLHNLPVTQPYVQDKLGHTNII